jgi:type V secretory pathway adhesin AidA
VQGTGVVAVALLVATQAQAQCGPAGFVGLSSVTSFTSILNTIDTAYLTQTNAFVVSQPGARPNEWGGGVWARGVGGQVTVDASATVTVGGTPFPCSARSRLSYEGFQVGADLAQFNLDRSTGTNVHFGLTGGSIYGDGGQINGPAHGTADVPFIGIYGALNTRNGIFADLLARWTFIDQDITQLQAGLNEQKADAREFAVSASAGYHMTFGSWFLEPSAALVVGRLSVDQVTVPGNPPVVPGTMLVQDIDTVLSRFGVRVGTTVKVAGFSLQPFVAANVWHESAGDAKLSFNDASGVNQFTLTASRVGTYGQYVAGVAAQVPDSSWSAYARVDYRKGEDLEAWGVNAGLRYNF